MHFCIKYYTNLIHYKAIFYNTIRFSAIKLIQYKRVLYGHLCSVNELNDKTQSAKFWMKRTDLSSPSLTLKEKLQKEHAQDKPRLFVFYFSINQTSPN